MENKMIFSFNKAQLAILCDLVTAYYFKRIDEHQATELVVFPAKLQAISTILDLKKLIGRLRDEYNRLAKKPKLRASPLSFSCREIYLIASSLDKKAKVFKDVKTIGVVASFIDMIAKHIEDYITVHHNAIMKVSTTKEVLTETEKQTIN
jgi:hypothetical protein